MMDKRLAKVLTFGVFLTVLAVPAVAFASEGTPRRLSHGSSAPRRRWPLVSRWPSPLSVQRYAQAKIGSAAAGTLAERPEVAIWVITLQALPEVIVLLGFVSAIMINTAA